MDVDVGSTGYALGTNVQTDTPGGIFRVQLIEQQAIVGGIPAW